MDANLIETFRGPLLVTLAYVAIYYLLMLHLMVIKTRLFREYAARGDKLDRYFSQDRTLLAADRKVLNMLEHMPAFTLLLWLHAALVDPTSATVAGAIYVAARAAYPFLLGSALGRGVPVRVLAATFTGYGVLLYLAGGLVWALV